MTTKSVKFIKYHPLFSHDVGDEVDLTSEDAKILIDEGFAEESGKKHTAESKAHVGAETATGKGHNKK